MHPKRKPSPACQHATEVPSLPMTRLLRTLAILLFSVSLTIHADAQSPTPAAGGSEAAELLSLTKKIDEQNIKIDALSQQILRLQQEIEHPRGTSLGSPLPVARGNLFTGARPRADPPTSSPGARRSLRSRKCTKSASTSCKNSTTSKTTGNCRSARRSSFPARKLPPPLPLRTPPCLTNNGIVANQLWLVEEDGDVPVP